MSWSARIHEVTSIRTVADFWSCFAHLSRPSTLSNSATYYLFRDGIRPEWEDSGNVGGGRWVTTITPLDPANKTAVATAVDDVWIHLTLTLVANRALHTGDSALEASAAEYPTGVSLAVRDGAFRLAVWVPPPLPSSASIDPSTTAAPAPDAVAAAPSADAAAPPAQPPAPLTPPTIAAAHWLCGFAARVAAVASVEPSSRAAPRVCDVAVAATAAFELHGAVGKTRPRVPIGAVEAEVVRRAALGGVVNAWQAIGIDGVGDVGGGAAGDRLGSDASSVGAPEWIDGLLPPQAAQPRTLPPQAEATVTSSGAQPEAVADAVSAGGVTSALPHAALVVG